MRGRPGAAPAPRGAPDASRDDMARKDDTRLKARLARGFADRTAAEIRATEALTARIRRVYEAYGFEPVETPLVEYADALGKFLPDQDRPNEGVFSFQDDDEQWLALRYDLTAPLARFVAEHFERTPKPFRSYRAGWVFRNEKPGPGRFRQFMQFDADTVGAASPAADAEMCMMMADTLEALGIPRGAYVVRVNSRKVLDGLMEVAGIAADDGARRLAVLRAVDKLDRLGPEGVHALLGEGRKDESGDYTPGARLSPAQIDTVMGLLVPAAPHVPAEPHGEPMAALVAIREAVAGSAAGAAGADELEAIARLCAAAGFGTDRVVVDPSCVRGLEYYTGPVFEAELTFEVADDEGRPVRFGSVGGGGRYDGLVGRFRGEDVPATGFSIGVSRLVAALAARGAAVGEAAPGPVIVAVMDRERIADYQRLAMELRAALNPPGQETVVPVEMYVGEAGMKAQLKYADRRNAPCVLIQGSEERRNGEIQVKDMAEGKRQAAAIADNATWRAERPAQFSVPEGEAAAAVRAVLVRAGVLPGAAGDG